VKRGIVYALGSAVLFGISTPLAKLLLGEVPPLVLAGLLYASSGVGLVVIVAGRALSTSASRPIALPARGDWRWLAGAIALGGVVGPVALMFGLARSAASTASLLLNLEAVFTALIAWSMFRENFDRRIALGVAAVVAGGLMLAWAPVESGSTAVGLLLIVAACLCWGIDNNLTRRISAGDAVVIAALKGLVAGSVNLGLAFALGYRLPTLAAWASTAAVGFFGYGVSLASSRRCARRCLLFRGAVLRCAARHPAAARAVDMAIDDRGHPHGGGRLAARQRTAFARACAHVNAAHAQPRARRASSACARVRLGRPRAPCASSRACADRAHARALPGRASPAPALRRPT